MPLHLQYIELENFKSYCGYHRIGPFKSFNAIMGTNGAGKSNLMDAISYVMAEGISSLRVPRLSDLIHGAAYGKPVTERTSVTAIFLFEDGTEKRFQRIMRNEASAYTIDMLSVTRLQYISELNKLGINVKSKNFLIFQGAVENIGLKEPLDYSSMFEEISGSSEFKDEYHKYWLLLRHNEVDLKFLNSEKDHFLNKRKDLIRDKDEADKYTRLKKKLTDKQIELQLFKLFHNEDFDEKLKLFGVTVRSDIENITKKKEEAEEVLKEKKKENGILQREIAKLEQTIKEVEVEISKNQPAFIKAKESVKHGEEKLKGMQEYLEEVVKSNEAHVSDMHKLKLELDKVEKELNTLKNDTPGNQTYPSQESIFKDYERLKNETLEKASGSLFTFSTAKTKLKDHQDQLENEIRKRNEYENEESLKKNELVEIDKKQNRLKENIDETTKDLSRKHTMKSDLETNLKEEKDKTLELKKALAIVEKSIGERLDDAEIHDPEAARHANEPDIVETFKKYNIGVYGRIRNLCQPIDARYRLPVTKAFSKHMDAIVVDTMKTARSCLNILKEQRLKRETFLPLDSIITKPLKEHRRNLSPNVRLLFDVIRFEPPEIYPAIIYIVKNTLVCETSEEASDIAYTRRISVIGLDGTFYEKQGIISGGSVNLEKKAREWDEKEMSRLINKKKDLILNLEENMILLRKESLLAGYDVEIKGLEGRLQYMSLQGEMLVDKKKEIEKERAHFEFMKRQLEVSHIEAMIKNCNETVTEIQREIHDIEDDVFKKFCHDNGVANIRQWEEANLKNHRQRNERQNDLENQKSRIENMLNYENSCSTSKLDKTKLIERLVQDTNDELNRSRQASVKLQKYMDGKQERITELMTEIQAKQDESKENEADINDDTPKIKDFLDAIAFAEKEDASNNVKIKANYNRRHNILRRCKLEGLTIPMMCGNMDDIYILTNENRETTSTTVPFEETNTINESRIRIDYRSLKSELRQRDKYVDDRDMLIRGINELHDEINSIIKPNLKAAENLIKNKIEFDKFKVKYDSSVAEMNAEKKEFTRIQNLRRDKFLECFNVIAEKIDPIYKSLNDNDSAQAFLLPENPEEPYLGGISYNTIAPLKRFQPMSSLSGGEKTIAALALLFAMHSYRPAPFFVLDEIDAALDFKNMNKVIKFIRATCKEIQIFVISLKEEFYCNADVLIGVYSDTSERPVSDVLMMDLSMIKP